MNRGILMSAMVAGAVAILAMLAATVIWMTIPIRIVYQQSSIVRTDVFNVEVRQHGKSFFVTPQQKKTLDRINSGVPLVWFGSLGVAVVATLVGAAAWLRQPHSPSA